MFSKMPFMKHAAGFSLLELIVVIVIIGVLSVSAVSRFANEDGFSVKVDQEGLVAALTQAQQLAMSGQPVEFSIANGTPQTYRIRIGSPLADYSVAGINYPLSVDNAITLAPSPLTITYDNLGRVSATPTITVSAASGATGNVCIAPSGLAYVC